MLHIFRNIRNSSQSLNTECIKTTFSIVITRQKHFNPKFKWHRGQKYIPVDLPDFNEKESIEQRRTRLKELGIGPPRYWRTRPITVTSLNDIVDPYKPPEADGKATILKKDGFKSVLKSVMNKKDDLKALREIKSYDNSFSIKAFPQEAHDIYVKAHTLLMNKDPEELSDYVTEKAICEMMEGLKYRTLRWKFIESLEPPLVVQSRSCPSVIKSNIFAQITVRFHTRQCLAIYDRFGRLFYGSEILPKDVLEYVVFEKQIVNEYGTWRMHGKIIPDWVPPSEPATRTYRVEKPVEEDDDEDVFIEEDRDAPESTAEPVTAAPAPT